MKKASLTFTFTLLFIGYWAQAQIPAKAPANQQEAMTQLLDYSRPGPNHALLAILVGTWTFQDKKLPFVKGTVIRKSIFEGRFFWVEIIGGSLEIPVADGRMKVANYQGLEIEGYDNVKKSYVTTSINNHIGSNAAQQIGQYDAQTSLITYEWESELLPGVRQKKRKVLHLLDPDHYSEEYYEGQNGHPKKTRELLYTRSIAK